MLVVLDDVDHVMQLDALAKEARWFGPGSRIIMTTHKIKEFCKDTRLTIYMRWVSHLTVRLLKSSARMLLVKSHRVMVLRAFLGKLHNLPVTSL